MHAVQGSDFFTHVKKCLQLNTRIYLNFMGANPMVSIVHQETLKDTILKKECNQKASARGGSCPLLLTGADRRVARERDRPAAYGDTTAQSYALLCCALLRRGTIGF